MRLTDVKPTRISIELTAKCNLDCDYCPRHHLADYRKRDMKLSTFKIIVDNLPKSIKWVHPQGYGEPLMYPQLVEAIQYATDKRYKTKFFTNGVLITSDKVRSLAKAGLTEIVFSVDEKDPSLDNTKRQSKITYAKIAVALNQFKQFKTKTIIRMTRTEENKKRISKTQKHWEQFADAVAISPEFTVCTPFNTGNYHWAYTTKQSKTHPCEQIYSHMMIRSDGEIVLCCQDWFSQYTLRNIKSVWNHGLELIDIFNDWKMKKVRKDLALGRNIPVICEMCPTCR